MSGAAGDVRATQNFVRTLSLCWRRPFLTALEVCWRWLFGVPACALIWHELRGVVAAAPFDVMAAVRGLTLVERVRSTQTLVEIFSAVGPGILRVMVWLAPVLLAVWVVVSGVGRTVVLRRADRALAVRVGTVMVLQVVRVVALAGSFCVWVECLLWAGRVCVAGPINAGAEPNLVGYFAMVIVASLVLFVMWAVVSWVLSVAPLLAMLHDEGPGRSLRRAVRLGPLKMTLVEINLVMGIVKIALVVLAMVFSATPLPFEGVATPEFMLRWYVGVTLVYFVASDFFHVARLLAYLDLWRRVGEKSVAA